jgi:integrase
MSLRYAKLGRAAIKSLPAEGSIAEHGVIAFKQTNGDIRYSINIMVDGQRIHRVVGRESEGVTREQAERLIEKLRTAAREGRLSLPSGRKLHRSLKDAASEYLSRVEQTGGKDLKNKRRHLESRLVPALGAERLDKITTTRLQHYRSFRRREGASAATINREMATLSHLLRRASSKDWGWISPETVPEIPKEREARKRIQILSSKQQDALLSAAAKDADPRAWLFVMFGLNTAMRHSEIMARRYDEVDFENCRIWIDRAKAGERQQPITLALRDSLRRQSKMEEDPFGWIFPAQRRNSKHPHRRDMRDVFARVVSRAGLNPKHCTPHVMRHTAISQLVMARADIPTIQKISGHKTPGMVLHYVHLFGEHVNNAIAVLDRRVPELITPELHTLNESGSPPDSGLAKRSRRKSAA